MVDILLVQPPIRDFYLTAKRTVPYGLAAIAAALIARGFTVDILDGLATKKSRPLPCPPEMSYLEPFYGRPDLSPFALFHQYRHYGYSYQHIQKTAKASGALLVGISALFTPYIEEALQTAATIRTVLPNCKIVLGGHHPTALPTEAMESPDVDFVIRGEGETALPELAQALRQHRPLYQVPGIVYRKKNGTLHISEPAVMKNLDHMPLPARQLIKDRFYQRNKKGATVIVTSRGCPMTCSYCALGNQHLYPYRQRALNTVLNEITEAVTIHGARFIDFEDENLSLNRDWFLALLKAISEQFGHHHLELRAMNGLFPPTLDEKVVTAMKRAGFSALNLSLGSICPDQLIRFHRPDIRSAFDRAVTLAENSHMHAVGYIIVGAPGQSATDSITDLLYLATRRILAGVSVYYPAPGSRDYGTCGTLGLLPKSFSLMRASTLPISHTTTRLEAVTLLRLGRIINFMKHLIDTGNTVPIPKKRNTTTHLPTTDREKIGVQLLAWFLEDGIIRGITPEGIIYDHDTACDITRLFIKRLHNHPAKGSGLN